MKLVIVILFVTFFITCTKDNTPVTLSGIWVEQSLRLDTFDFVAGDTLGTYRGYKTLGFKCKPFSDVSINPNYPINNSAFFAYYYTADSLFLLNFISSSLTFQKCKFQMSTNQQTFNVSRFYNRNSLPATLTFEKIK
ncbi:MAG: hypothetical protein QM541_04525 [Flavobacterium sp.]|nr:hypothetical protein [Flavobacterium sp.]